jgi:hypothetical protein
VRTVSIIRAMLAITTRLHGDVSQKAIIFKSYRKRIKTCLFNIEDIFLSVQYHCRCSGRNEEEKGRVSYIERRTLRTLLLQ